MCYGGALAAVHKGAGDRVCQELARAEPPQQVRAAAGGLGAQEGGRYHLRPVQRAQQHKQGNLRIVFGARGQEHEREGAALGVAREGGAPQAGAGQDEVDLGGQVDEGEVVHRKGPIARYVGAFEPSVAPRVSVAARVDLGARRGGRGEGVRAGEGRRRLGGR